ncbi:MAG: adenylate/guanylate cyclase domain-containing protein [Deltaproteobacteria bacterium]|nr:adenylate/guanylate cyclase domain-containing protein [Deltaproteobacteria bacterium]
MPPPALLTPAARPRPPFPTVTASAFAAGAVAGAFTPSGSLAELAVTVATSLAACAFAAWIEERVFLALASRRRLSRLLLAFFLPLFGSASLGLASLLLVPVVSVFGNPSAAKASISFAALWFFSAATGSFVVLALDLGISALVPRLRERLVLAIFALLAIVSAFAAATAILVGSVEAGAGVSVSIGSGGLSMASGRGATPNPDAKLWVALGGIVFALPAILSACGKLADAIMERLHPLALGFRAVSDGHLDIQVEEAGSRDFVELSQGFNGMVRALGDARRLEHTFGRYIGKQLLGRLQAQRGEAAIPAAAREASVFFADVRGFTSMSEKLRPEQVLSVLNRYFERAVEVIDAHEGYLNKFVGDAVVVVFNGPVDQPDHAARAARCAVDLQKAIAELNANGAFPEIGELSVGVGVSTGPVVAGNLGSSARQMEYTLIGDTVNLAARLCSKAPGGEVWVSEHTAKALPERTGAALEPVPVKGKAQPVTPWRIWPAPADMTAPIVR